MKYTGLRFWHHYHSCSVQSSHTSCIKGQSPEKKPRTPAGTRQARTEPSALAGDGRRGQQASRTKADLQPHFTWPTHKELFPFVSNKDNITYPRTKHWRENLNSSAVPCLPARRELGEETTTHKMEPTAPCSPTPEEAARQPGRNRPWKQGCTCHKWGN